MPPRAFVLPKQGVRPETDAYAKTALQSAVQAAQRNANVVPWSDGKLFQAVTIGASAFLTLAHGLGRTPAGFVVTKAIGSNAIVVLAETDITAETIKFYNNSGLLNAIVDLWVY